MRAATKVPGWASSRSSPIPTGALIGLIEPEFFHAASLRPLKIPFPLQFRPGVDPGLFFSWLWARVRPAASLRPMSPLVIAYSVICVFLAAIVRGYSGFGFSLLAITSLSLCCSRPRSCPRSSCSKSRRACTFCRASGTTFTGDRLLPLIARLPDRHAVRRMLLAIVPAAPMQLALAHLCSDRDLSPVAGLCAQDACRGPLALDRGRGGRGSSAMAPLASPGRLSSCSISPRPPGTRCGRASLIAFFLATDLIGLPFLAREGLVTRDRLLPRRDLPACRSLAGVWLGARSFKTADPARVPQDDPGICSRCWQF